MIDDVFVQRVEVQWTKASRGGAGAARRNAVPLVWDWPYDSRARVHRVRVLERDDFQPAGPNSIITDQEISKKLATELGLRFETEGGPTLALQPAVSPWWAPPRHGRKPHARIAPGQWLQWLLNYRLGGGEWAYGLVAYNVAVAPADPAHPFAGEPAHAIDERAVLR